MHGIHYSPLPVLSTDILNYLVLTSFCTPDRFTAYKSLDAYKYFASGFVNSVGGRLLGDNFVVVGMVCTPVVYVARAFVIFSLYVLTVGKALQKTLPLCFRAIYSSKIVGIIDCHETKLKYHPTF